MGMQGKNRWSDSKSKVRYKKWRKNVFELNRAKRGLRKWYVCEKCSKRRKTTRALHAHHIYSWERHPSKRYLRENGMVLCISCHNKFHRKYRYLALANPDLIWEYTGKKPDKIRSFNKGLFGGLGLNEKGKWPDNEEPQEE